MLEKNIHNKRQEKKMVKILDFLSVYCMASNATSEYSLMQISDLKKVLFLIKNKKNFTRLKERSSKFFAMSLNEKDEHLMKYTVALKDAIRIMESDDVKNKEKFISYIDEEMKILEERVKEITIKMEEENKKTSNIHNKN